MRATRTGSSLSIKSSPFIILDQIWPCFTFTAPAPVYAAVNILRESFSEFPSGGTVLGLNPQGDGWWPSSLPTSAVLQSIGVIHVHASAKCSFSCSSEEPEGGRGGVDGSSSSKQRLQHFKHFREIPGKQGLFLQEEIWKPYGGFCEKS